MRAPLRTIFVGYDHMAYACGAFDKWAQCIYDGIWRHARRTLDLGIQQLWASLRGDHELFERFPLLGCRCFEWQMAREQVDLVAKTRHSVEE